MTTREAYEQVVKELCAATKRKDHDTLAWLAHTIGILWERTKQEAVAKDMGAFHPHQVIMLANSNHRTHQAIQQMKDNMDTYASLFMTELPN